MRISLTITAILLAGMMSGCCCGPINNCGGDCGGGGFVDYGGGCGGAGGCGPCVSPLNGLAQVRKALICGSGCGEAYTDEWCSTPPDACDPCNGGNFVGGASPCVSPCWYPGKALLGFVGGVAGCASQKFCQFCNCVASQCTCGAYGGGCNSGGGCGSGGCGTVATGGCGGCGSQVISDGYNMGGQVISDGGGCSTCSSNNVTTGTRIATQAGANQRTAVMTNQRTARGNAVRRGAIQADSYHTRNTLYR